MKKMMTIAILMVCLSAMGQSKKDNQIHLFFDTAPTCMEINRLLMANGYAVAEYIEDFGIITTKRKEIEKTSVDVIFTITRFEDQIIINGQWINKMFSESPEPIQFKNWAVDKAAWNAMVKLSAIFNSEKIEYRRM